MKTVTDRRRWLLAGLAVGVLGVVVCPPARAAESAPLRLCADPANLPFTSNDSKVPGFYTELGEALGTALGRPVTANWSLSYFGQRATRTTLLAGQCDVALGLPRDGGFMGPKVIFSRAVVQEGYALVVPAGRSVRSLDDLRGQRVAVQFASVPQGLLATREDITTVTVMDPQEGMRALAGGQADAAILWGPSAGFINASTLGSRYRVIPVAGPGMQWDAALGFARKDTGLRDEVDGALVTLRPVIESLAAKYGFPAGPALDLGRTGEARVILAAETTTAAPPPPPAAPAVMASATPNQSAFAVPTDPVNIAKGHGLFNGTCAHCHGVDAMQIDRRINLRLLQHRYGEKMDEVFHTTVTHGRMTKGMPNWSGVFNEEQFGQIVAWLHTVQTPE